MKNLAVIKNVNYKNEVIVKVEDEIGQQFDVILGVTNLFASTADAKRHIDGKPTKHEIEHTVVTDEVCNWVEVWALENLMSEPAEKVEEVEVTAEEVGALEEVIATEEPTEPEPVEAPEEKKAKKAKKEKVTYFYFAVTHEDYKSGMIAPEYGIDGLRESGRKELQRKLNEAGYLSDGRWVIVGAEQGGKVLGYGLNKEEAVNARWAA